MSSRRKHVFCKLVGVQAKVLGREAIKTCAFLDDGSAVTFIEREFAKSIGLKGTLRPSQYLL